MDNGLKYICPQCRKVTSYLENNNEKFIQFCTIPTVVDFIYRKLLNIHSIFEPRTMPNSSVTSSSGDTLDILDLYHL